MLATGVIVLTYVGLSQDAWVPLISLLARSSYFQQIIWAKVGSEKV